MTTKGFFALVQQHGAVNQLESAYALALSLKMTQHAVSNLSIGVVSGSTVHDRYRWAFDQVIDIPWRDPHAKQVNKIADEWKAIHMSPYDETVKIDSDMLFTRDISLWWELMSTQDMWLCNSVLDQDYKAVIDDKRRVFADNDLPDVRTALMFFKKVAVIYETFRMFGQISINWKLLGKECLRRRFSNADITADLAMAVTLKLTDITQEWHVTNAVPTLVHCSAPIELSSSGSLTCNGVELALPVQHRNNQALVDQFIAAHESRLLLS